MGAMYYFYPNVCLGGRIHKRDLALDHRLNH